MPDRTVSIREIRQSEGGAQFGVYTEDGYAFSLSAKGIYDTGISVGKTYGAEAFEEIRCYAAEEKVFRRAVYLLGNRDYGSEELLRKLAAEGENGEKAVARLVSLGYIDDVAYARKVIARYAPSYGRRRVETELKKRFLSREVYEELLENLWDEAPETIREELCRRMRGQEIRDRKEYQKMFAYFLRRGYDAEEIRQAFGEYKEDTDL